MLQRAAKADLSAIQAFLAPRVASSMFLSGNLQDYGLSQDRDDDHPKSMTLWFTTAQGRVTNVLGYARSGYFIFEAPDFTADLSAKLRQVLQGRVLRGLNGVASQLGELVNALDLPLDQAVMDEVEPHYRLELSRLAVPQGTGDLRRATEADLDFLTSWRMASEVEVLGGRDTEENRAYARASLQEILTADRLRILQVDGVPVAMTNFNAALPSIVQVGGVFTPPELRGQGYARRAVALHLAEACAAGIREAILFAANPAASRAYEAIGFVQIGEYRIVNFDPAITLPGLTRGDVS